VKRIISALFVFFALVVSANAGDFYLCIDRNGNSIATDSPQDGMRDCVLKESYVKPSQEEMTNGKEKGFVEKGNAIVKAKETPEVKVKRINNCINCCNDRIPGCYNYTADNRLCLAENKNCVATCKSEGSSSSTWSDCWSQFVSK
jgi:hypothetical protein